MFFIFINVVSAIEKKVNQRASRSIFKGVLPSEKYVSCVIVRILFSIRPLFVQFDTFTRFSLANIRNSLTLHHTFANE